MFFFPEGTRSPDGTLQPFKTGAFRLALEAGVDILPLVIHGSYEAAPKHSLLIHQKSEMSLIVLPPVLVAPFLTLDRDRAVEELKQTTWNHVADCLAKNKVGLT